MVPALPNPPPHVMGDLEIFKQFLKERAEKVLCFRVDLNLKGDLTSRGKLDDFTNKMTIYII